MGKVIGKQGNTINAIRGLLQAGSAKVDERCALEVTELEFSLPSERSFTIIGCVPEACSVWDRIMKVDIYVTLFPKEMLSATFGQAFSNVRVKRVLLRSACMAWFTRDKHKMVDDRPFEVWQRDGHQT